jgi:protein-disulfide isomerase
MSDAHPKLTPPVSARDHMHGAADAPVTLVEYGDYECSTCGQAFPVIKEIQRHMGARLRFVFRNFPLVDSHPHAERAAEAAEAAASQERFWEMHDTLYRHQRALDDRHLLGYAKTLGLDLVRFEQDLVERRHLPRVREDVESAIRSGARGTPTMFINGIFHREWWDVETMVEALEVAARS